MLIVDVSIWLTGSLCLFLQGVLANTDAESIRRIVAA